MTDPDPARMEQALRRIIAGLEANAEDNGIPPSLTPVEVVWIARRGLDADEWEGLR